MVGSHRSIWERHHKACLLSWAEVHHIDFDHSNNSIENLQGLCTWTHDDVHDRMGRNKPQTLLEKKHILWTAMNVKSTEEELKEKTQTFTIHIPKELNKRFSKVCIDKEKDKKDVILEYIERWVKANE